MANPGPMKDSVWQGYVSKGTTLLRAWGAVPESPYFVPPSAWTDPNDDTLKLEGWSMERVYYDLEKENEFMSKMDALQGTLGLHGDFQYRRSWNDVDLERMPYTGACYSSHISVGSGTILALTSESPKYSKGEKLPPDFLQHWSDVVFLQWADCVSKARAEGKSIAALNCVVRCGIINDDTTSVVEEIVRRIERGHGSQDNKASFAAQPIEDGIREPPPWPGFVFPMNLDEDGEEARALLGTPNGKGVGYFLLQHPDQLGRRKINQVRMWTDDRQPEEEELMLQFSIVDADTSAEAVTCGSLRLLRRIAAHLMLSQ